MSGTRSTLFAIAALVTGTASAQISPPEEQDLFTLIVAPIDLTDATRMMTIYDPNEDGFIDKDEQIRIRWRSEIDTFDLNRDGKLTHVELAIRFAKMRADAGVEQKHVDNAGVFMRRHDKNGNGQLDTDEVGNPWPNDPEEFDSNRDGIITLGEMAKRFAFMAGLRREMGIEQVDQVTAIRTVRKFDQDKDQRLDADEQKGAFLPLPAKDFDEDNDGKVGIMEIATMLAKHRRDTGMSKSDLAKVRSIFERFDGDSNGKIDKTEFQSAATALGNNSTFNPLIELDRNGDQTLTQSEIQQTMIDRRKSLGFDDDDLAEAKKLLTRHDTNRNTLIEESELHEKPISGQLAKTLVKTADRDGDRRISVLELAQHLAQKQSKSKP